MVSFRCTQRFVTSGVLIGLIAATPVSAPAAQQNAPPDFSSDRAGWVGLNGGGPFYEPVPGAPNHLSPIVSDPAYPFRANGSGGQSTYRIADLSNPNLMPWVKDHMKKDIEEVLAGKYAFTPQSSCWPSGVPFFTGYGGPDPLVFLQTPKDVWILWREDNQSRHIRMNVAHSPDAKPSWYGDSVGHYEGDTLVIDTVGLNTRTVVDIYRTPHTEKLHVIERWRKIDDGKMMEVRFVVEDEGAFYEPWSGMRRYRHVEQEADEKICAEGNTVFFGDAMPTARRPDF
jgi:hypothetical protein